MKPNHVLENGMQAHKALHSSNSQRRNSFDSVECPALGALSSCAACLPPSPVSLFLMLSIWRFMQKCAASRPPWSPSILSAGTPACHKLSYAEIVKLRLLASCLTDAFFCLCTSNRDDACKERQQMLSSECCSLHLWKWKRQNVCFIIFFISLFYSVLVALSCSLLPHNYSLTVHFLLFPSEVFRDPTPIWDIAGVQKYSCLIKSSYVPGYVCLNWHLAVFSFFDSDPLFNTCSIEHWLLLTVVLPWEVGPNSINNLSGYLRKWWSI